MNSNFPHRWSPASLTLNNYFLPSFIFIFNENNHKQQRATSKIIKEPKQKSRPCTASKEITGGGGGLQLVCGRPTLALSSTLIPQTLVNLAQCRNAFVLGEDSHLDHIYLQSNFHVNSDIFSLLFFFVPPLSEKLRGAYWFGPVICLSVRNTFWQLGNSRPAYARILIFYMWH